MARPLKKPDFNSDKLQKAILDMVVDAYENGGSDKNHRSVEAVADELQMSRLKVRKILITAGVREQRTIFDSELGNEVLALYRNGKSIQEIAAITGLKRASINGYLPYTKTIYKMDEQSVEAERVQRYRDRQKKCRDFCEGILFRSSEENETILWEVLQELQVCTFQTFRGKKFHYKTRGGELFADLKKQSITRSSVNLAFHNALQVQREEGYVSGPKKLGCFGSTYLYPIFLRIGFITKEKVEE